MNITRSDITESRNFNFQRGQERRVGNVSLKNQFTINNSGIPRPRGSVRYFYSVIYSITCHVIPVKPNNMTTEVKNNSTNYTSRCAGWCNYKTRAAKVKAPQIRRWRHLRGDMPSRVISWWGQTAMQLISMPTFDCIGCLALGSQTIQPRAASLSLIR